MKKFYTILKILSLKNKIKGRKGFFNQIQNSIDNNTKISVKLKQDFLQPKKEEDKIDNINAPSIVPEQSGTRIIDHSNIKKSFDTVLKHGREKNEKFKKIIPNDDFMPLIANIFSRPNITRTLTDLKNKYASLQNLIPTEIVYEDNNESLKEGICFSYSLYFGCKDTKRFLYIKIYFKISIFFIYFLRTYIKRCTFAANL